MSLGLHIYESEGDPNDHEGYYWSWEFIVPMSNIREAKPYLKLSREDFETELRSAKLDQIID
jgi:hypothetical protein